MPLQNCQVTVRDIEGVMHSVDVTASTLYEAVAIGLRALRENEFAGEIPDGLSQVTVTVAFPRVEHKVDMQLFNQWLERSDRSPADKTHRARVRVLLGKGAK
jgi:hypothetical protein